ncbi:MAG: Rha family transcriptional regulator [Candidatus Methylumidiphilus sp.]
MNTQNLVELKPVKGEPRVDSRLIARELGNQHESMIRLIDDYRSDFEEFGVVRFQTQKPQANEFPDFKSENSQAKAKRGRPERFALLNEDQAYLLLTYARNTPEARRLKLNLV